MRLFWRLPLLASCNDAWFIGSVLVADSFGCRSREPLPRNFEHIRIQTSSRLELEKEGIRVLQE